MTFTYWSNKTTWHEKELLKVAAANILEADKIFNTWARIDVVKNPWISVTIEFPEKQNEQRG